VSDIATYLGKDAAAWAQTLGHRDPVMRRLAVYALGEIGPPAQPLLPALSQRLDDKVNWVRVWTAAAVASVTGERRAVDLLVGETAAPEAFVRSLAAWHLGRLGADFPGMEAGLDSLRHLAGDPDPSVRAEAGLALQALQSRGSLPSGSAFLASP
jgi:HEAT repeat protein